MKINYRDTIEKRDVIKQSAVISSRYTVYDEMACEVLLETGDQKLARDTAYNHQCILMLDGKVIHDYSCDW